MSKFKQLVSKTTKEMDRYVPSGVKSIASDVLSAPKRMKANRSIKQSNKDLATIKNARKYKNVPSFDAYDNPNKSAIKAKDDLVAVKIRYKKNGK